MTREFQRVLKGSLGDNILIPVLNAILLNPQFDGFEVPLPSFAPRPPDGWFHPSTHPTWDERLLWWYLVAPEQLFFDELDIDGCLAVTQGTFWHEFFQHVLLVHDLVLVMNPKGRFSHDKVEYFVQDKEVGSRGSMDGVLNPDKLRINLPIGFEFKTMRTLKLGTCPKSGPKSPEVLEWLKKKCPEYYAQAQDYLRMSGYSEMRMLLMGLETPYPKIEIAIPFSYGDAEKVADKYRRVRQAVAGQFMPPPCCGPMSQASKQCVARGICPIALGRLE